MKICFLSLNSYPILTGKNLGYAGGAEVEQVHLARELAAHGYNVFFVTYRHGLNPTESACGIEVVKTYEREKREEIHTLVKYGFLWRSLKKVGADIYFHQAGSYGVLPVFCHMNRRKFVHRIASDAEVLGRLLRGGHSLTARLAETLEIERANVLIAQSEFQRRMLKERFGAKSVVIKNGLTIPKINRQKEDPPFVLWVGSISSVKNPHLFVELAKSIPCARFEMVGGKTEAEPELYNEIAAVAQKLPNLRFRGFIPYNVVGEYFKRASIFVNTSSIEGFPNTFIEAWAHYTPVVSLNVDPDKVIQTEKSGFWSRTFQQLVSDVTTLLDHEELRKTMGKNARKYVEREHDIRKRVKEYIEIFRRLT